MLHLQLPSPMPHAVHSDVADSSLFQRSRKAQQSRPSEARLWAGFDSLPSPHQSIPDRSIRPPHSLEMTNFVRGSSLGTTHQYNLRRSGNDGGYGSRAHGHSSQQRATGTVSTNGTQNSSRPGNVTSNSLRPSTASHQSSYPERRKSPANSVAPGLQIPPMINTPQGSMPKLAAEITCLFWFEGSSLLRRIEEMTSPPLTVSPLASDAVPSTGFRKWVATILSTTQVSQNVILLALLFIYRLKRINPTVKGKPGSEYRLLTVALMLGNKFLDDNTYTNKTWAEVSGISVQEVHVMEVEFLSNMRYSLYTSDADWKTWQVKLGKFGTYYDRALRALESPPRLAGGYLSPMNAAPTLPSPPVSNHASPPYIAANFSPTHLTRTNTPLLLPQITSATVSPIGPLPELDIRANGRKRSYDDQAQEPPSKRAARSFPTQLPSFSSSTAQTAPSNQTSSGQRLQLPSLSISALQNSSAPQLTAPLPPPGGRAMSLVYPPPVQWNQPSASSLPTTQPTSQPQVNGTYGDRSRQLSPLHSIPGSTSSSPMSATYAPPPAHTQPHNRLSPSYYLQQRSSPYRPVRQVQTLLVPPPSASMHSPAKQISHEQMQYQPLGRPFNERRTGHLPYVNQDWPTSHPHNNWNELPPLPQPVFHR